MNTDQITRVIDRDPATRAIFRGVYPRDDFILLVTDKPGKKTSTELFIVNLDDCDKPGSHWIVIDRHQGDTFYFDSYGMPPLHGDLADKLIDMTRSTISWNNTHLQELDTNVCGQYCILYCLLRAREFTPEQIINTLHHGGQLSNHQRDHVIATVINKRFGTTLPKLTRDIHDIEQFIPS